MHSERRRKRSTFAGLALHYWLAAVAERSKLFALVLADSSGLLVAASIRGPEAEELAAVAPLLARPDENGETPVERHRVPVRIKPVEINDQRLFLCAVGDSPTCQVGLGQAFSGVARILA